MRVESQGEPEQSCVFRMWQDSCTHEFTIAVVTYIGPYEAMAVKNCSMEVRGTPQHPSLDEDLSAVDGLQGEG